MSRSKSRDFPRTRHLLLESLESRQLLAAAPELLVDLNPDGLSDTRGFTLVGDTVYFSDGGAQLWATDGTPANTAFVKDLFPGSSLTESAKIVDFSAAGSVLAFVVFDDHGTPGDGSATDDRVQIWKSDGTPPGTVLVKDLGLGSTIPSYGGKSLTTVGQLVFAGISTPGFGYELWVSDLDPANSGGTHLVKDIFAGTGGSYLSDPLAYAGKLYFAADDGTHGAELWSSDGTEGGTQLVKDIKGALGNNYGSYPTGMTAGEGGFFFLASDSGGDEDLSTTNDNRVELWTSDGTLGGTSLVYAFDLATSLPWGGLGFPELTYVPEAGKLFAVVEHQDGGLRSQDLVCWDGAGAHHWNLYPGGNDAVGNLSPAFGLLGFAASDATHGREPWLSDGDSGNSNGTFMIKDINAGLESGVSSGDVGLAPFPALGGIVYFPANDGVNGTELWQSNGSEGGTVLVADIRPGSGLGQPYSSYPDFLTAAQG